MVYELVLAAAVRKLGEYDLLLFGKMAVDGDTAQVGPEVAGQFGHSPSDAFDGGFGHIGYLYVCEEEGRSFTPTYGGGFTLCRDGWPGDGGTGLSHTDRLAVAQRQTILHWDECDLGLEPSQVGLQASPTQVVSTWCLDGRKTWNGFPTGKSFLQSSVKA